MLQPDLGTALAIALRRHRHDVPRRARLSLVRRQRRSAAAVRPRLPIFFVLHDYQRAASSIFLDPDSDPLGAGYHITQSKIAIGSGGHLGKGFVNGSQSHLRLPARAAHRFRLRDHGRGMGPVRHAVRACWCYTVILRWGVLVPSRAKSQFARLTGRWDDRDDLLLRRSINLAMVTGPCPGRRHPVAASVAMADRR